MSIRNHSTLRKVAVLGIAALMMATTAQAGEKDSTRHKEPADNGTRVTWLGVTAESMHPALVSHLHELLGKGRGVLVGEVAVASPAEKAGLKKYDILLSLHDGEHEHQLYSPEQLAKVVHHNRPGQEISLDLIRAGKPISVRMTLGERTSLTGRIEQLFPILRFTPDNWHTPLLTPPSDTAWDRFDSLSFARTGEDDYRLEFDYRKSDDKVIHRRYEGSKSDIRKSIQTDEELTAADRFHLLRTLNLDRTPLDLWPRSTRPWGYEQTPSWYGHRSRS